jgi:hypothetical protein
MTETTYSNNARTPSDTIKESTSTFVVDRGVTEAIESVLENGQLSTLTHPEPSNPPTATPSITTSPFTGHNERLTALITNESSSELFDKTQAVRMLDMFGSIDRNLGAINVKSFTNELIRYSGCSKSEAVQFCADFLNHYDIRSVVLHVYEHSDLSFLGALPDRPNALFIRVQSNEMLSAKSGSQSNVVLGIIEAGLDLSELHSFSFGAHSAFNKSPTLLNVAPLLQKLSEAQQLTTLSLNKCDITGASSATVLGNLESLLLHNSKCTVEDLKPLVRAQVVDLTGTDMGENRTFSGFFQRSRLGETLGKHFTSEMSRLTELTLPQFTLNTNVSVLQALKSGGANPTKIELQTVNLSGAPDSGYQRQVLMEREKHFPKLSSPYNSTYEKVVRWFNQ